MTSQFHRLYRFGASTPSASQPATDQPGLTATVDRTSHRLELHFKLDDSFGEFILAKPVAKPERCDNLWRSSCFEWFLAASGSSIYWEFNLSPSGAWNIYRFSDYRQGMARENSYSALPFQSKSQFEGLELWINCNLSPIIAANQSFELALCSVLQHQDHSLSYWATHHPGCQPDFHDRGGFTLEF